MSLLQLLVRSSARASPARNNPLAPFSLRSRIAVHSPARCSLPALPVPTMHPRALPCPQTADRAISVLRRLLVPVAQSALDTTPGSVLFDLINNDLGFATKNVNAYLTRDNVQLATNFIQAFTSSTDEDTLSLLVEAADLAGGAVGADYDYGSVLGYVANNPFGIVGVLVGLGAELRESGAGGRGQAGGRLEYGTAVVGGARRGRSCGERGGTGYTHGPARVPCVPAYSTHTTCPHTLPAHKVPLPTTGSPPHATRLQCPWTVV